MPAIASLVNNPVYLFFPAYALPVSCSQLTHAPFKCISDAPLQQMYEIQYHIHEQTIGCSGLLGRMTIGPV